MAKKKPGVKAVNLAPVSDNPQTAEEFAQRGWHNYSAREYAKAEADYRRALDLAKDNPDYHYALALNLAAAGKSQEAVATFENVIECIKGDESDDNVVRNHMLTRLSRGHINRIKTGEWRLEV